LERKHWELTEALIQYQWANSWGSRMDWIGFLSL
jgi:hypothetical protein